MFWVSHNTMRHPAEKQISPLIFLLSVVSLSFSFESSNSSSSSAVLGRSSSWQIKLKEEQTSDLAKVTQHTHITEQQRANTIRTYLIVGTANGSKLSKSFRSMGTEMRPSQSLFGISCSQRQYFSSWLHVYGPVFGWTLKGLFSKWFTPLLTLTSSRG